MSDKEHEGISFNTIKDIEQHMALIMLRPEYERVLKTFELFLGILGNVDGNEVVALVGLAYFCENALKEE